MVDLNRIFREFLGVLFAPDEFRTLQDLFQNDCISKRSLMSLFNKVEIDFDLLIRILDVYEVSIYRNNNNTC